MEMTDIQHPEDDVGTSASTTVECGCCFREVSAADVAYCSNSDPHSFCFTCAQKYAEEEIGGKMNIHLACLDTSGCPTSFPENEIRRFLDSKTFQGLERLRTDHEIKQIDIEGLVHCPFCPFAAIIEDPTQLVFECLLCGVSSCRDCHLKEHPPLTCEEYRVQNKQAAKHIVEEAMSAALIRRCNKCSKPFVKEDGCNEMRCRCGNLQCYLCSSDIIAGEPSHFAQGVNAGGGKCAQFGDAQEYLKMEVALAQEKAISELLQSHSRLEDVDVRVEKKPPEAALLTEHEIDLIIEEALAARLGVWPDPIRLPQRSHRCFECDKGFYTARALSQHLEAKGHCIESFQCQICDKVFYTATSLSSHQNAKGHHDIRCSICDKEFYSDRALSQHQEAKDHFEFPCPRCDRSFGSSHALFQHRRDKHGWVRKR